jgi:DNA-directed RNA polymerase sigma subunit (sigma70/sigma32)
MAAIARIEAIPDLEERGRAIAKLLRDLTETHREAVKLRREIVLGLRSAGLSHADVGEVFGVARETAAQIAAGKQTGRRRTRPSDG